MIDDEAVELVGKGVRGGKRVAFSTASSPVRRRRIVHKSIASRVSAHQHDTLHDVVVVILARDAQIRRAVLHVGRYVGRADDDETQPLPVAVDNQLARGLGVLDRRHARAREERQRLVKAAPFGERDGEREHDGRAAFALHQVIDEALDLIERRDLVALL